MLSILFDKLIVFAIFLTEFQDLMERVGGRLPSDPTEPGICRRPLQLGTEGNAAFAAAEFEKR